MSNDATLAPARKVTPIKPPLCSTTVTAKPIENEALGVKAAPATLEQPTKQPYYEADAELRDVRNISVLVQWIERARLLSEKVVFWQQHSPQFAEVVEGDAFDAPSWGDDESDALVHLAIQQERKLRDLTKHLEGRAS